MARCEQDQYTTGYDLRVGRSPYVVNQDTEVFSLCEIDEVWDFVKDSAEWFVDVYECIKESDGFRHAEYTGFAIIGGQCE